MEGKKLVTPCSKSGFTLIELLVVVLIIGILAAVALPQYQKAMDKARYLKIITLVENMWKAQERYKLANGVYSSKFDVLDIDMPLSDNGTPNANQTDYFYSWGRCWFPGNNSAACTYKLSTNVNVWYMLPGRVCVASPADNKRANELCQALTKKSTGSLYNGGAQKLYVF